MAAPMTILGIGPAIVLPGYLFIVGMGWALRLGCCPVSWTRLDATWFYAGWIMITGGLVVIVTSLLEVWRARRSGRLVTAGIFGRCRHPIYAAQMALIMPGIAAAMGNLLLLGAIPLTGLMFVCLIGIEERALEREFGEEYSDYRQRVPRLVPFGRR